MTRQRADNFLKQSYMRGHLGIRHEDKYKMERRTPLTPSHIKQIIENNQLKVSVQRSDKRIFTNEEYRKAGGIITDCLKECNVILGVKEIPVDLFEPHKTYVFFSHVIKGQPYNMPMLRKMMDLGCNLIDYECITDDENRRIIFFGRFAGLAGMINSLWSLGQRLRFYGYDDNPFISIRQSHTYNSLEEVKEEIANVGNKISKGALPKTLLPFVVGFTGYGNVSQGAQEIMDLLPFSEISPGELTELVQKQTHPDNLLYKVIFKEEHLVRIRPTNGDHRADLSYNSASFDLQHYYDHPELYESCFASYLPHLSMLMNCMYWDNRYPRLVTKQQVKALFEGAPPKLTVIGDITCDPEGSVQITHKGTTIEEPVFVYDPTTDKPVMGFAGRGMLVMAVEILPSELPRDASMAFSEALLPFVESIATADFTKPHEQLALPDAIKKALILHQGRLTPAYSYLEEYL